jgi:phosphoenolpyruvate carboxykinase (ATP)
MLAAKLEKVGAPAYLVNTGWTGGAYGAGSRMSLKHTRQLIDAVHDGSLEGIQWEEMPIFGLQMPASGVKDVALETLQPMKAWLKNGQPADKFQETATGLARLFQNNFKEYADLCSPAVVQAGPKA